MAFELVGPLPTATQTLQRVRRSAARVFGLMEATPPVSEPLEPAELPQAPYHLRATGLGARYPGAEHAALEGVDIDLGPRRRVAVVGASGAGKSTLAGVLLRFLDYEQGAVTLDGVEISDLSGEDCRRVVGLVGQDAHIFDTTVEENLRMASRQATEGEIRGALSAVRLLDWVESLPAGMDTELGERGARMSGGQRQRLAVARALLADFPVLVLDEPGEHLDTATADGILADLLVLTRTGRRY